MDPAPTTVPPTGELDAVRLRRAELRESLGALEQALAAPAAGRPADWGKAVQAALTDVQGDWQTHVAVTEGPNGLHQAIRSASFRLVHAVEALTTEHATIAADLDRLVAAAEQPVAADAVAELREGAVRLLGAVVRHRQRGADLIYEAFESDIGGDG